MGKTKRILALFLAMMLCVSLFPTGALADGTVLTYGRSSGEFDSISAEGPFMSSDGLPALDSEAELPPASAPGDDGSFDEQDDSAFPSEGPEIDTAEDESNYSGDCGEHLTWSFDPESGVLLISGYGEMQDWYGEHWYSIDSLITCVEMVGEISSIGNSAFSYCVNLTSITIPESVTRIGWNAFSNCTSLQELTIPNSVTSLGSGAFFGCTSLTTVVLPEGLLCIEDGTFRACDNLINLSLPDSVESIGDYAFDGCISLPELVIPDSVTSLGDGAFSSCKTLSSMSIPPSVTSIGDSLFSDCISLSSVTIPESVTSIGNGAFRSCANLNDVTIPSAVTRIGDDVFNGCVSLQGLTIPYSINSIGQSAFEGCVELTEMDIPDSVTTIEKYAFRYCSGLTNVTLSNSLESISEGLFYECDSLKDLIIPGSVKSIGTGAFDGCRSLSSIIIPEGVTSIEDWTFDYCTGLRSVSIPASVYSIGSRAFYSCISLQEITIPEYVGSIGNEAFSGCTSLHDIVFRGSAPVFESSITGNYVFFDVTADAYYPVNDPSWTSEVRQDYGGHITWLQYWKSNIGNIADIDLSNYSLVVYINQKTGTDPEDKYVLAEGVKVMIGSVEYTTDRNGSVTVDLNGPATFEKSGYLSRTLTEKQLLLNNAVFLEKEVSPAILSLWLRAEDGSDRDLRHQELVMDPWQTSIRLEPEIYWGDGGPGRLFLYQDGVEKELSLSNGSFTMIFSELMSTYDMSEDIFLVAKDTLGDVSRRKIQFRIGTTIPEPLEGITLQFDGSYSVTFPESLGILGGTEFKFNFPSRVPVEIQIEDGKWYMAIGYQKAGESSGDGNWTPKTWVSHVAALQKSINSAADEIQKFKRISDAMIGLKGVLGILDGSLGLDASFIVMGFAEGYIDSNNKIVMTNNGGIIYVELSANYTQPFMVGPVPAFLEFSLGAEVEAQLNIALATGRKDLKVSAEVTGAISVSVGLGVGISSLASVSGGVKGEIRNYLRFQECKMTHCKITASLSWYIKVKCLCYSWQDGDAFLEWIVAEGPNSELAYNCEDTGQDVIAELYDTSNYRMDALNYLFAGSALIQGSASLLNVADPQQGSEDFLTNAYQGADPQALRFSDGTMLAVWIGYNDYLVGPNGLQLFFSYYDGNTWCDPRPVNNDGTMDAAPTLMLVDDTAWLAWQDCSEIIPANAALDEVAGMMGISAACFDRSTESFVASEIVPADGTWNADPVICADDDALYVIWRNNTAGEIFGHSGDELILCSIFSEGNWSDPAILYTAVGPILSFDADTGGGGLSIAWCCDTDGDLTTSEDLEIYLNGGQITYNNYIDSGVKFCGGSLFWYSGGNLVVDGTPILTDSITVHSDRFQVLLDEGSMAIVYAEADGLSTILKAIIFDRTNNAWGSPIIISDGSNSIPYFFAVLGVGEFSILMENQSIVGDLGEEDPYGSCSLQWFNIPLVCDIALNELHYENSSYIQGKDMVFSLDVSNRGMVTVDKLKIEIMDENGIVLGSNTIEKTLLPGNVITVEGGFTVENIEQGKQVTVRVSPDGKTDVKPNNNSAVAVLKWNDLCVQNACYGITSDEEYVIHADIVNRGYDTQREIIVELRENTPDGRIKDQITLDEIEPFTVCHICFLEGSNPAEAYYIVISEPEEDDDLGNNMDFVVILQEYSHIPGDINGDGLVNNKDVTRLINYIKHGSAAVAAALDVNGDGTVNNKDVTRLITYLKHGNGTIY